MLIFANPLLTRRLGQVSLGLGLIGLASVAAGLLFVNTWSPYGLCRFFLPFAALSWLVALLALVLGGIVRKERSGRRGLLAGSTTIVLFLLFWANMGLPPCGESWPSGARGAIRDLRTINQAEITYASTYRSYSPSLATPLGPGTGSTPTATAAGLIDEVLARGTKKGTCSLIRQVCVTLTGGLTLTQLLPTRRNTGKRESGSSSAIKRV